MSRNTNRDESGQFDSELSNEDIISYFAGRRPFHTAQEVADRFDIDRSTAYRRLSRLDEEDRLEKVSLGSRTVVWWYTTEADQPPQEVATDDSLFAAPTFSTDEAVVDDAIDDILYGEISE